MFFNTRQQNPILKKVPFSSSRIDVLIIKDCISDTCPAPSKIKIGQGSYAGNTAEKRIMEGKSKHFNIYTCDKFKTGKCNGCYSENKGK